MPPLSPKTKSYLRLAVYQPTLLRCLLILALAIAALTPAAAQTPDTATHTIEGVRNVRYCEIIPVVRRGLHLTATVYNTLGLNDCPAALWDKITEAAMRKRFGAFKCSTARAISSWMRSPPKATLPPGKTVQQA